MAGFLKRSEVINENDPYSLYIKSIYLYEKDEYSEAIVALEKIQKQGFKFPYVSLLMADIYEYKLGESENALVQLKKYMNLLNDTEVESRIKELDNK